MHEVGEMSAVITARIKNPDSVTEPDLFARFPPAARTHAANLLQEWIDQLRYLEGFKGRSARHYHLTLVRLLSVAGVLPWELRKPHVTACLKSCQGRDGAPAAPQTVSSYCSAWRSFQSFLLDADRANIIAQQFGVRPQTFLNEENAIPIKRVKANWKPVGWSLTDEYIDRIEDWFIDRIKTARGQNSKSLFVLLRDRVMFHIGIHFALRISELVMLTLDQFHPSPDPKLQVFGRMGTLTVSGKNDVTGTIPMREPMIHQLLSNYLDNILPVLISRAKKIPNAPTMAEQNERIVPTNQLIFLSERGGLVSPNVFRRRLQEICRELCLPQKMTPHTLRHSGCTRMAQLYSPEVAQRYMRHKNLGTTLHYYHPDPINAGTHLDPVHAMALACDEEIDE